MSSYDEELTISQIDDHIHDFEDISNLQLFSNFSQHLAPYLTSKFQNESPSHSNELHQSSQTRNPTEMNHLDLANMKDETDSMLTSRKTHIDVPANVLAKVNQNLISSVGNSNLLQGQISKQNRDEIDSIITNSHRPITQKNLAASGPAGSGGVERQVASSEISIPRSIKSHSSSHSNSNSNANTNTTSSILQNVTYTSISRKYITLDIIKQKLRNPNPIYSNKDKILTSYGSTETLNTFNLAQSHNFSTAYNLNKGVAVLNNNGKYLTIPFQANVMKLDKNTQHELLKKCQYKNNIASVIKLNRKPALRSRIIKSTKFNTNSNQLVSKIRIKHLNKVSEMRAGILNVDEFEACENYENDGIVYFLCSDRIFSPSSQNSNQKSQNTNKLNDLKITHLIPFDDYPPPKNNSKDNKNSNDYTKYQPNYQVNNTSVKNRIIRQDSAGIERTTSDNVMRSHHYKSIRSNHYADDQDLYWVVLGDFFGYHMFVYLFTPLS